MKDKNNTNTVRINKMVYLLVFLLFMFFIMWLSYITLVNYKVGDTDIETFRKIYLNTCIILYPVKKVSIVNNNKRLIDVIKIYLKIRHLDDNDTDKKIKENYIS